MIISTQASYPMKDIARELGDQERWFQLYWSSENTVVESFVRRAEAIDCSTIVVTLDTMVLSWRTGDLDHAFLPFGRGMGIAQHTSDPAFTGPVRALLTQARRHPGGLRDNLRSSRPRAAVETFLDDFSRPR